ncbi:hypothetical protein [Brevibacillus centrosporus]|uniref:hypothetical protein n=1 Tax=Brevibacillus centrosporus TaxID=54910 RepID=UPI003B0219B8
MRNITTLLVMLLASRYDGPKQASIPDSIPPLPFPERIRLVEQFSRIDDFDSGEEPDETQLKKLQRHSSRKDYRRVLLQFFVRELGHEIAFFQTIVLQEQYRHLLVVTTDEWLYSVSLKQCPEYKGIWTVDIYGACLLVDEVLKHLGN